MTDSNDIDGKAGEIMTDLSAAKSLREGNLARDVSRKAFFRDAFLLLVSALFYCSAFPPLDFHYAAWIGLVPLFLLVKDRTPRKAFLYGYIWGYFWACTTFNWLREIEIFVPYLLAFILALFPAFWTFSIPFFRRYFFVPVEVQLSGRDEEKAYMNSDNPSKLKELYLLLILSAWWCVLEWIRTWICSGFPWNPMAVSQWKNIALIQICEYTGVYGVSFIVMAFNMGLAISMPCWKKIITQGRYQRPIPFFVGLVIMMASISVGSHGMFKWIREKADHKFLAAVVQADIPQCRQASEKEAKDALDEYMRLSEIVVASRPELVIWPETAVPVPFRSSCEFGKNYRGRLSTLIMKHKIPFLIGTIDFGDAPVIDGQKIEYPIHNSAILIDPESGIVDRYHKIHLVPWGEYTPLGELYPLLKRYFNMGRNLTPGTIYTIFEIGPKVRAGVEICYEDIFPSISRNLARNGANLLVVITNDAWYPKSSEPVQHLSHSVFRAVETKLPIIRAGNNCGSCYISPAGVVKESITVDYDEKTDSYVPAPEKKMKCAGTFQMALMENPQPTFYTRHGNLFIYLCSAMVLIAFFHAAMLWRKKKEILIRTVSR